jgi:hypothetical protein
MASLTEHAEAIKAAIKAAEDDGLRVEFDLDYYGSGHTRTIDLDVWDDGNWVTVKSEDREQS